MTTTTGDAPGSALPIQNLPEHPSGGGQRLQHLAGVTVLDLTTSVAGPYATMLLADFGARVLKVERPARGDDSRAWGPPFLDGESLWFLSVNRNKESVTLDYTTDAGREVLEALVRDVDVVVTNQPPNVQTKLGVDFGTLKALNDQLIFASITGFGLSGERAAWTCYDLIAEGYSGVMDITGAADSAPQKIGAPAADMLAGQDAAMTVMAALVRRAQSPGPQLLDIALVDSMTRFLSCRAVPYLGSGEVPRRSGGTDSVIAIYQVFRTADEPMTLGLGTDGIWRRFWNAVGQPGRADHPEDGSNADRRRRRAAIVADIQAVLSTKPRAAWLEAFAAARVPAGPINTVAEVAADPHLIARGLFYTLADGERRIPQVGLGIHCDGQTPDPGTAPPRLGAHTDNVLREHLGMTEDTIQHLRGQGVI